MLLIMNKFCVNQSFKEQGSVKRMMRKLPLFSVDFCEYYYYLKKETFGALKSHRICYLRTKLIKKRCLYSLIDDFSNKFYN